MPSPEALTRLVLWLWVIVVFPAALTALVDLAFGTRSGKLALRTGSGVARCGCRDAAGETRNRHPIDLQAEGLELLELTAACPDGGPAPSCALAKSRSPHHRTAGRAAHAASSVSAHTSARPARAVPRGCVRGMPKRRWHEADAPLPAASHARRRAAARL